jgi:hypothetical protein
MVSSTQKIFYIGDIMVIPRAVHAKIPLTRRSTMVTARPVYGLTYCLVDASDVIFFNTTGPVIVRSIAHDDNAERNGTINNIYHAPRYCLRWRPLF